MRSEYDYADYSQKKQTSKWLWLLVVVVGLYFMYWAVKSCYEESVICRGQGCLIVWIETAFVFGLAYLLLMPTYAWIAAGRPGWVGILAAGGVALSFGLLYFHTSHFEEGTSTWSNLSFWHQRESAAIPSHLLLSIGITGLLLFFRAAFYWFRRR
ncbi:hypothetical protein [Hymenobacter wooponensis]|uniref:Uncharacterized protein n=1 Tax=Hymenobacter wooponensis TaxID=1525360 RepID=A0A4Z0MRS4_9BACT|nr:hypothetical protein [Hymenobacter wooponensis]TGD82523.1 hypothetical protein EU557_01675 [Hymenobacter wooponensis]